MTQESLVVTTEDHKQPLSEAAANFVTWLDSQVTKAGRGDGTERLEVEPSSRFWLGLLAPEQEVREAQEKYGERGERLSPCAMGIRLRPSAERGPWSFTVTVSCRTWIKDDQYHEYPWRRSARVETTLYVTYDGGGAASFGQAELTDELAATGLVDLSAKVRVSQSRWRGRPELLIEVVNTSPRPGKGKKATHHLYEVGMTVRDLPTIPFQLESLPDTFRYNRDIPAYGHNCGVTGTGGVFRTTDTVVVSRGRPDYEVGLSDPPDLTFDTLARDPLPELTGLVNSFAEWVDRTWSDSALADRARRQGWEHEMLDAAQTDACLVRDEVERLRSGVRLLTDNQGLLRAFQLMNRAIEHSATQVDGTQKYTSWRPFQVAFLLSTIPAAAGDEVDADVVDSVWFATGGGKTETYLGLLVTAALYERLTGRIAGITGWARFPLRMLSIQQTQRFANALAGAEIVRRSEGISGDPISLGFYVGASGTPNRVPVEQTPDTDDVDVEDDSMPGRFQVLRQCPFCHHESVEMAFERREWRLEHRCTRSGQGCPWPERALPVLIVDAEIYRFLPTVVVGTLDKAALMGSQAAMAGFFGPPHGMCSVAGHGHVYASRSSRKNGCLVPGCPGSSTRLPQPAHRYGMSMRLQDELHLLRDSLGAVDSHYESLIDHIQYSRTGNRCKVIASSATLTGQDHQTGVLFNRRSRVFPQQGVSANEGFWSSEADPDDEQGKLQRRFVAVAPRGVTHEYVNDRTVEALQRGIRRLLDEPDTVCAEARVDVSYVDTLVSYYGVDVVYGTTVRDVEAARRSLETEIDVDMSINAQTLTGNTPFEEVRSVLDQLESPQEQYEDRIHAIAASSMLSHGVDVERLNIMVMLGLPLTTAEFIQTTSRVGRKLPGLVYVLHRMPRERDAATFRQFGAFVRQGDRFVEPVPVTRRSRRVLDLTLPGIVEARRLLVHEPNSSNALTMIQKYRQYLVDRSVTVESELEELVKLLGLDGEVDHALREHIREWLDRWRHQLDYPPPNVKFPNEVLPYESRPMMSLRDVEPSAPIRD